MKGGTVMENNVIETISDEILIKMCNELYDWHFGNTGCLDQTGEVAKFARENTNQDAYRAESIIVIEAHKRYTKTVKYLFTQNASLYIDRR